MKFTVPGQPHPAERPRGMPRKGKGGRMFVVYLTPDRTLEAEARVADAYRAAFPGTEPTEDLVAVLITAHRATKVWADTDNLAKTVLDGLNGVAWADDRQVATLGVERVLGVPKGTERTEVEVVPLTRGQRATLVIYDDPVEG